MAKMKTVVKYVPIMKDKTKEIFPSHIMSGDTEEEAREYARRSTYHEFTGLIGKLVWEQPIDW